MEWDEPDLVKYDFRFGAKAHPAVARLGFPRQDAQYPDEWICSFQIQGVKDSRIRRARGEDGLQALTIASSAIRNTLDRLKGVTSDSVPHEVVFPRYLPFCCGLDFHRKLCGLVDAEIKKQQRRLARRRRSRNKSG
jgi:uncharacterized protein DUF6968